LDQAFVLDAGSCMLLKKEYDTDEDEDENDSSTGDSDTDEDQVLDPASEAYKRLPAAVKNQLQKLSGQIESLYDENKKSCMLGMCMSSNAGCFCLPNWLTVGSRATV